MLEEYDSQVCMPCAGELPKKHYRQWLWNLLGFARRKPVLVLAKPDQSATAR
jgi:hypothetical protein